jgi:acyl-CoA dehydrogenase
MTEQQTMLVEMVERLFADMMAAGMPKLAAKDLQDPLWSSLEELGLCELFAPEEEGGFGGTWQDAFYVFKLAGRHALPLPIGETLVAKKLLLDAGINHSGGALTLGIAQQAALKKDATSDHWLLTANACAVPWGVYASNIVLACSHQNEEFLLLLRSDSAAVVQHFTNEAGEQRCDLRFDNAVVTQIQPQISAGETMHQLGALLRSAQIAGALEAALNQTVAYTNERVQFGRSLSQFQVIQHQLALLAEETAAVSCAARAACRSADVGDASFEVAAAKLRANRSVTQSTSIAHQCHGAIGFTEEHVLHFFTQRLWSWRSEFGNDRHWATYLGRRVLAEGAENFWPNLTARSDRN